MEYFKLIIATVLISLFNSFNLHAQTWAVPKDENGWSILSPSADSRIIYVSSTDGNDVTASTYSPEQVGEDPRNPVVNVNAFKTLNTALNRLRDGYPDWILLKRGDDFENADIRLNTIGSGKNPNERLVMTYYGDSGERPVIKNCSFISYKNVRNDFWAFVGISFYDSNSDPNSPDYVTSRDGSGTLTFLAGGSHILIEDCILKFYSLTIQGYDGPFYKIEIRRNILTDQYRKESCNAGERSSSAFISNVHDYLIEENLTDFSGWNETLLPGTGRNMFNHGWYLQYDCSGELIFRGNMMCRASANAVQNRSGGMVENNLVIQCPVGLFVAHDTSHGAGANSGITCSKNNVVIEGLWSGDCPASSGANWGMPLGDNLEQGTLVEGNIVTHNIDKRGSIVAIQQVSKCNYIDNIIYDWRASEDMWNPNWQDPERTVGSYSESIGIESTTEAFIDSARNRMVNDWPVELSAYGVIDYIREGFNMDSIGNKISYTIPTNLKEIKYKTGIENIKIYPNPVNEITNISYVLRKAGIVKIKLYNQLGKEIATVTNQFQNAGANTVQIDAKNLESGVYILKLRASGYAVNAHKLVINNL